MNHEKTLPSISAEAFAQERECLPEHLEYWAWPKYLAPLQDPSESLQGRA